MIEDLVEVGNDTTGFGVTVRAANIPREELWQSDPEGGGSGPPMARPEHSSTAAQEAGRISPGRVGRKLRESAGRDEFTSGLEPPG
jgi:hypothetical protein